jgi:aminoglycoside phosphotransferase (APT) family kinase protein
MVEPELGPLVGTGRSADVFDYGKGRVLRRYREPRDTELEVRAMEYARSHGFPAPTARAIDRTDIVMDKIEGASMLTDLSRRPWLIARHAATLASLHERLHSIPAPEWLDAPLGPGHAFLHLDLHPDNVLLTDVGPVVIDWPNAAKGPPEADVAHTWLVLNFAATPGDIGRRAAAIGGRRLFCALFMRRFDWRRVSALIPDVARFRLAHRTLPAVEHEAIRQLAESA